MSGVISSHHQNPSAHGMRARTRALKFKNALNHLVSSLHTFQAILSISKICARAWVRARHPPFYHDAVKHRQAFYRILVEHKILINLTPFSTFYVH